jgi:hypothetical protein
MGKELAFLLEFFLPNRSDLIAPHNVYILSAPAEARRFTRETSFRSAHTEKSAKKAKK